jgi:hypothetical protein
MLVTTGGSEKADHDSKHDELLREQRRRRLAHIGRLDFRCVLLGSGFIQNRTTAESFINLRPIVAASSPTMPLIE